MCTARGGKELEKVWKKYRWFYRRVEPEDMKYLDWIRVSFLKVDFSIRDGKIYARTGGLRDRFHRMGAESQRGSDISRKARCVSPGRLDGNCAGHRRFGRTSEGGTAAFTYIPERMCVECDCSGIRSQFRFLDRSGLCLISTADAEDEQLARTVLNDCWTVLRREIDGGSEMDGGCTAMDEVYGPFTDPYSAILAGFVDAAERITDLRGYVSRRNPSLFRLDSESRAESVLESNAFYFRSFLSLYGSRIPESHRRRLEDVFELRVEKFRSTVSDHHRDYSVRSSASMLVLTGAALVTAVASMISALGRGGKAPLLFVRPSRRPSRAAGRRIRTSRSS